MFQNTVQPVLSKYQKDNQNVLAKDRCLLYTWDFQLICPFRKLNTCLHIIQVACLIEVTTKTSLTVYCSHKDCLNIWGGLDWQIKSYLTLMMPFFGWSFRSYLIRVVVFV